MHCFDSKLAFDLLGERQAANCHCFRAASNFREFPDFEVAFLFLKRFELSEAVERLERLERASFA